MSSLVAAGAYDAPGPEHLRPRASRKVSPRLPGIRSREEAVLWGGCLVVLLVLWISIVFESVEEARQDQRERKSLAVSTAKGFSEYVRLHTLLVDGVLLGAREEFQATGAIQPHAKLVTGMGSSAPALLQVAVANARGEIVASSLGASRGVSIADRPHFRAVRDEPGERLYVGQPVVGRVSGKMSLQLVRPLHGPHGEFKGIIVASVDPLRLQHYFNSVDAFAGGQTVVIVGRDDGVIRARFDGADITWGQSLLPSRFWETMSRDEAGSFEVKSVIDRQQRIVGFHAVGNYPLIVSVSSRLQPWSLLQVGRVGAVGLALTFVAILYVRSRVKNLRDRELVITQLRRARALEAEAKRMKSSFVASISHELRTPLNAILGFSELLRDAPEHPDNVKRAALVHDSGRHLMEMLNILMDLAKIDAGRLEIYRSEVDLVDATRRIVDAHRAGASAKGLSLAFESLVAAGQPVTADTDRARFEQVLNNLMDNALKFTQHGGIRVDVRADGREFVVRVSDTGRGIAPELMPHIFDRFSSSTTRATTQEESAHLGLFLSRELTRLLGGSIHISSVPGTGTQVSIRLPAANLPEQAT